MISTPIRCYPGWASLSDHRGQVNNASPTIQAAAQFSCRVLHIRSWIYWEANGKGLLRIVQPMTLAYIPYSSPTLFISATEVCTSNKYHGSCMLSFRRYSESQAFQYADGPRSLFSFVQRGVSYGSKGRPHVVLHNTLRFCTRS